MSSFRENIELLIQNGKTLEAIDQLLDVLKHRDRLLYTKLLIISGEYKELNLDNLVGKIRPEVYRISLVNIKSTLLEINNIIPNETIGRIKITNLPDRDWLFLSVSADYVNDVVSLIEDSDRRPFLNLVLGMAGIGKTYLARKVALKYSVEQKERFDVIWFVNSESIETIISDLKDLGVYFNISYQGDNDIFLKDLKKALTDSDLTWLVIFDNACDRSTDDNDPKIFADKYFPRTEFPKQILVTSQNIDWVYVFAPRKHIRLKNWEFKDYIEFLRSNDIDNYNSVEIEFLYSEFGGLPLAIAQSVGYIKKKNISVGRYIDLLKINKQKLLQEKEIAIDYKNSVLNAVILSFDSLQDSSKELLLLISFLAPDNIPINLLFTHVNQKLVKSYPEITNSFSDALDLENAKSELLNYYLAEQVNTNDEIISIHRIIKLTIQIYIFNTSIFTAYLKTSTKIINETFDLDYSKIDVDEFEHFEVLLPHILSVLANCESNIDKLDDVIIDAANLSYKLGKYYVRLGNDHESLTKLKEAKHFNEYNKIFFNDILNARICLQIGHLYYLSDERDSNNKSIVLFEYSSTIFNKHKLLVESSRCVNNIGSIYLMRRDYNNAIFWYEKGISVSEESFLHHNLGYVYQSMGDYDLAIKHYDISLELSIQAKSNHRIGINYHLLGIVYGLRSNFTKQIEYHDKCLALYRDMQQSRRISYCLFQMINFSMDRKEYNNLINLWYTEHKKYYDFISEDSEYLLNSLILESRFAILNNEKNENILSLYQRIKDNEDILLSYPTDSHTTSTYLDFAIYFYNTKDLIKSLDAVEHAINFIEDRVFHRKDELNDFFKTIKKSTS